MFDSNRNGDELRALGGWTNGSDWDPWIDGLGEYVDGIEQIQMNTGTLGWSDYVGATTTDQFQGYGWTASKVGFGVARDIGVAAATLGTGNLIIAGRGGVLIRSVFAAGQTYEGYNTMNSSYHAVDQYSQGNFGTGTLYVASAAVSGGTFVSGIVRPGVVRLKSGGRSGGLTALGGSPNRIAASSPEIESLVSQIKNVAQSSTFVRRAKSLGFADEHLAQIAGRIDALHASGNIGFIPSGGWIDDTQFLIGRSSLFRSGRIRHELGHLLDDIRSPGLLAEASSSRLSTLKIFGHEMTAFGTQVGRFNPIRPYGSLLTGIHNNYGYAGSVPFIGGSIYVVWFVSNEFSEWLWGKITDAS